MKILLDTCVWGGVKAMLQEAGHDVTWSGDWQSDPGDAEILAIAYHEQRVLITLDKDFGELAIVKQRPHCGIVRLVNFGGRQQGLVCLQILMQYGDELNLGAIITADPKRVRIRSVGDQAY